MATVLRMQLVYYGSLLAVIRFQEAPRGGRLHCFSWARRPLFWFFNSTCVSNQSKPAFLIQRAGVSTCDAFQGQVSFDIGSFMETTHTKDTFLDELVQCILDTILDKMPSERIMG